MEIELKSYSNASNARRAAKAANLIGFTLVKEGTGFVIVEAPAPAPALASTAPTGAPTKADKRSAAMADHDAFKAKQRAPRKAKAPKALKKDGLVAMVTKGATTAELMEALGWLPHTTRAALSRLSQVYAVEKTKLTDGGTRYKIAS